MVEISHCLLGNRASAGSVHVTRITSTAAKLGAAIRVFLRVESLLYILWGPAPKPPVLVSSLVVLRSVTLIYYLVEIL